jgi:hypothetical protein
MKIEIPNKVLVKLVMEYLPSQYSALGDILSNDPKHELRDFVAKTVLERIGEIELPKITAEEVKDRMITILAERALEKDEE